MVNFDILNKDKNIAMLSFSAMQSPIYTVNKQKGFVNYGKKNDFPNQLIRLYEEHSEHGAIVGAKANYLIGEGVIAKDKEQQLILDTFLNYANFNTSWDELFDKIKIDCELFNGFYLQVVTDLLGNPKDYFHLQFSNCRLSECKTKLYYSENWLNTSLEFKTFDLFTENKVGVFFTRFEFYKPSANNITNIYPKPQYIGCIKDISTDIDISTFNNNYVANGFSAGTLITFFNGEPTDDQKRVIKDQLINTHSTPEKAGSIVLNFANKDGQAANITALNVDDLDKKFEFTSKRALDKILRGHNVTNPELFGVKTDGQLGTRVSLSESYELMINTYTKPRQKSLLKFLSDLIFNKIGVRLDLEIKQLQPIGLDLTSDADLTQDERRKLKGYEPLTAKPLDANGLPIVANEVNSTVTNLSGRQFQGLMRIVTKYDAGKLNKQSALALMVSGFGLSETDALTFLNENDAEVAMEKQSDNYLQMFLDSAIQIDLNDELLFEEHVNFGSSADALKYELKAQKMFFADTLTISVTELRNAILKELKGNPTLTIKELAELLKVDISLVTNEVKYLQSKQLVTKQLEPTEKAYKKETENVISEVYTVYKYAVKDNVPNAKQSREFCEKLTAQSSLGKRWEFDTIDAMSNKMGSNAWDYRGGFYTNPDTNKTSPSCRHIWVAETRIRRK